MDLLAQLGGGMTTVLAFVVALAIIVTVHEFGHYSIGRLCGIHAEVFSLGMGPAVWSRVDKHGTRWQLAALPIGGYVRFKGDANAASAPDAQQMEAMSPEERRRSMPGAPLWARAATVIAGPLFNVVLTIVVFGGMIQWSGVPVEAPIIAEVHATPVGQGVLLAGDRIQSIGGVETPTQSDLGAALEKVAPAPLVPYRLDRAGKEISLEGPYPFPPLVSAVLPKSAAQDAGLRAGDVIVAVDGAPVYAFTQMPPLVEAAGGAPLALKVWRAGETFDVTLTPRRRDLPKPEGGFETRWLIGLTGGLVASFETRHPGPIETVRLSLEQTWQVTRTSLSGIWNILAGQISSCNVSGPIGMAEVMGTAARSGVETFMNTLAALSLGIGLLNLFPIPVLDGGHLVFHLYEAATGRKPSDAAMRLMMAFGMSLLLGLMLFALSNDLFCN